MQQTLSQPESEAQQQPTWRWWHFLLLLSLLGPILAPLFRTIGAQPFTGVANFIYWLGNLTLYPILQHNASATAQLLMLLFGLIGGTGVALLVEMLAELVRVPK